jgi:hypothetical protein
LLNTEAEPMTKKHTTMTQSEYAQARGLSRARVSQLSKAGKLAMTLDGRIDVAQTDALLALQTDNRGGSNRGGRAARELDAAARERMSSKQRREYYLAENAQLDYEERCGKLLERDQVKLVLADAFTTLRVHLEALPDILAPQLEHQDEERIRARLREEIERSLHELVARLQKLGTEEAAQS